MDIVKIAFQANPVIPLVVVILLMGLLAYSLYHSVSEELDNQLED